MTAPARRAGEITGAHVLTAILGFFAIVIAINVAFTVVAVRSFPGEDERRSYLQGLRFNDRIAARAAQARLGWAATADLTSADDGATVMVAFTDAAGEPVDGLTITGALRRPSTTRDDRALTFHPLGGGRYAAPVDAIAEGGWIIEGEAQRGDAAFAFERRLTWSPAR